MVQKSFKRSSASRDSAPKKDSVYKNAASSPKFRVKSEDYKHDRSFQRGGASCSSQSGCCCKSGKCSPVSTLLCVYGVVAVTALLVKAEKIVTDRLFGIPVLATMGVLLVVQGFVSWKMGKGGGRSCH